jgi:hypothetical protein
MIQSQLKTVGDVEAKATYEELEMSQYRLDNNSP